VLCISHRNDWVPPESALMDYLLGTLKYRDSRLLSLLATADAIDDATKRQPEGTCRYDTRIDWILFPHTAVFVPDDTVGTPSSISSSRRRGQTNASTTGKVTHQSRWEPHVIDYEVVETDATDHNMVVASFILREVIAE
jgi:hypothetical protein